MANTMRWGLVLVGTLFCAVGCGKSASSTGSNSNWLERCDADSDCPTHSECWCHTCSVACSEANDCAQGACQPSENLGCGTPSAQSPNVCVAACASDADCASQGPGLRCVGEACLHPQATGGAGGSGGIPETGGTGMIGDGAFGGGGSGGNRAGNGGTSGDAGAPPGGETLVPSGPRLGVSSTHACIVASRDGGAVTSEVWCWGDGLYGQIGSIERDVTRARNVQGVTDVASIALSGEHTCALTRSGDVYCWGKNDLGQIGGPSAAEDTCPDYVLDRGGFYPCQPTPTRVEAVSGAVRIAVSSGRSCALLASGQLQCWGDVAALSSFASTVSGATSVALGPEGACVTTGDGELSCSAALPGGAPPFGVAQVVLASDAFGTPAQDFMCLLGVDGIVRCLGDDSFGELGQGGTITESDFPPSLGDVRSVALGAAHACALGTDGVVRCWGRNSAGAVGSPPLTSPSCGYDTCERGPLEVFGLPPVEELAAGGDRACAFATSRAPTETDDRQGTLWCWGPYGYGNAYAPQRMTGPWEDGAILCEEEVPSFAVGADSLVAMADHACLTDGDCVLVSLDVSCSHSCAFESVSRAGAGVLSAGVLAVDAGLCSDAGLTGTCARPDVSCPTSATRPVCLNRQCTQDDPVHSGCDDACGCEAVREASLSVWKNECSGFDLWPIVGIACGVCEDSTSAVVVGNRGGQAFHGQAVISFESIENGTPAADLPEPLTVTLDLAPGAVSPAIHVPSKGAGSATLRVTAPGDCEPLDDASTYVDLPSPSNPCN